MAEPTRTEAGAVDPERLAAIRKRLQRAYTYEVRVRRTRNASADVRDLLDALAAAERRAEAAQESAAFERALNEQHQAALERAERDLAACREALRRLLGYTEQLELIVYDVSERDKTHADVAAARAALGPADGGG